MTFRLRKRWVVALVYVCGIVFGLTTFFFPPRSADTALGIVLTNVYAAFALGGAIGALIGIIKPNYRVEWTSVYFLAGGFASYAIALWTSALAQADGNTVPGAVGMTALTLLLVERAMYLAGENARLIGVARAVRK